ncbi:MAG: competence/damage-inducible protein A [Deltaproteobacteria bacterium]|nr:MAG: competence/damage-inducible protein A [Deltaproteobacteria bacterium]
MTDSNSGPRGALLLIGNELLTGKIQDANGPLVVESFRQQGVDLVEMRVIPDSVAGIATAVRELRDRSDFLITSGGVGPTHDDLTMCGVANAFDVPLVTHPVLEEGIRRFYANEPDQLRVWLRMAQVPEGCDLLFDAGNPWPVYHLSSTYILPGIPGIFRRQFEIVRRRFATHPVRQQTLYLTIGEGEIAELLEEIQRRHPAVEIGSYPLLGEGTIRTRVTLECREAGMLEDASEGLQQLLPAEALIEVEFDAARLKS